MQTPRFAYCTLITNCPLSHNVTVKVDPANEIREYNETNNEAWKEISLKDRLEVNIKSPTDDQNVYRCSALQLNSTVSTKCGSTLDSNYRVKWYDSKGVMDNVINLTVTNDSAVWCIGSSDSLLGSDTITAVATSSLYAQGSDSVTIQIRNNLPNVGEIWYNVTPPEIHLGHAIQIACKVNDTHNYYCAGSLISCTEDTETNLNVNISVKRPAPYNDWSNVSANYETGVFYRDYGTDATYPIGKYTAVCSASDSDNGHKETVSYFWVYQNATITLNVNATEVWWGDAVKVSGVAYYKDGSYVPSGTEVTISLNGELVNLTTIGDNGYYEGVFIAPLEVGEYILTVNFTDPFVPSKEYGNYTYIYVSPYYGGSESEMEKAKNVGCYEVPRFIQNPDGTIERVIVRVCVWK